MFPYNNAVVVCFTLQSTEPCARHVRGICEACATLVSGIKNLY